MLARTRPSAVEACVWSRAHVRPRARAELEQVRRADRRGVLPRVLPPGSTFVAYEDSDLHSKPALSATFQELRLGGFEPPTRGLEVRRSVP